MTVLRPRKVQPVGPPAKGAEPPGEATHVTVPCGGEAVTTDGRRT